MINRAHRQKRELLGVAELVYTRVSTDEQSTQRQTYLLAEAGLVDGADGVKLFSDPATSSKIPALERGGFAELAGCARPGDRLTVSELYRLCRDLADILAVREWCRAHGTALRVLSGPLSGIVDLAATDATTTMLVNVLVSVGQFSATCRTNSSEKVLSLPGTRAAAPAAVPASWSSASWTTCVPRFATAPASQRLPASTR